MTYVIAEIAVFLLVALLLGLPIGALLRGGSGGKVRDLEQRLRVAKEEAEANRREASRLEASVQSEAAGVDPRLVRLEHELRDARASADRAAAEIEDLRAQLAAAPALDVQGSDAMGLSSAEADRLRHQLAEANAALEVQTRRARALGEGDEATWGVDGEAPQWLAARNRWLEAELAAARGDAPATASDELARLRDRVAQLESAPRVVEPVNAALSQAEQDERNQLGWRNRYLDTRVKYLEGRVKSLVDAATSAALAAPALAQSRAPAAVAAAASVDGLQKIARDFEVERKKDGEGAGDGAPQSVEWRNRYLESRVTYLEERLREIEQAAPSAAPVASPDTGEVSRLRARVTDLERDLREARKPKPEAEPADGEYNLEWRNRYLTSRVRYLEEKLDELRGADGDA